MAASSASASKASPGVFARAREWLFRFRAIEAARAGDEPWRREHARRARAAADLADSTEEPTLADPAAYSTLALELYREAAHFALLALAEGRSTRDPAPDTLRRVAPELVLEAAGGTEALGEIERLLASPPGGEPTAASDDSSNAARRLAAFARSLVQTFDRVRPDVSALRLQRVLRLVVVVSFVTAVTALAVVSLRQYRNVSSNLARGKRWIPSSQAMPCDARAHACGEFRELDIFFHTNQEPSPWVDVDLGGEATFSRVLVRNRQDCCRERAVPLVIEVSSDRVHWREVMRQPSTFSTWNAKFSTQHARFVRLRVARTSILHLEDVKVLR
ncbi:MAG TPA: discoidin domain-containing protein [Polyangiaceae bacterium]